MDRTSSEYGLFICSHYCEEIKKETINIMKRVCAWCKKSLGDLECKVDDEHAVTHGMCNECAIKVATQIASLRLGLGNQSLEKQL